MNERSEDTRETANGGRLAGRRASAWLHAGLVSLFVAVVAAGCGGSTRSGTTSQTDAGNANSDDSGSAVLDVDGTTGQPCTTDAQCAGVGGPGTNKCSNDFVATVAGVTGQPLPAPVCSPDPTMDNCDPAPANDPFGNLPHFCDGPDDPSSPGLCVADDPSNPTSGMGTCQPKCTFALNGAMTTGCVAPDTCIVANFGEVQSGTTSSVVGYGYCQGTCQRDADCPAQAGVQAFCQTDVGFCTTQLMPRTLPIGAACTADDYQSGACNCNYDPVTLMGYCASVCVVGGTACPSGWVCDTGEPSSLNLGGGALSITTQTAGLAGYCAPACENPTATFAAVVVVDGGLQEAGDAGAEMGTDAETVEAGNAEAGLTEAGAVDAGMLVFGTEAGADAGSAGASTCPNGSTCTSGTVAGPDCVP